MKIEPIKVEYLDKMGSDLSVVNAARVSFAKQSEWEYDYLLERDNLSTKDAKLVKYLAKHGHWTPFAHTAISVRIKAPIFVARQLVKHQVGLTWNEVSRRYVEDEPSFYFPETWRGRPEGSVKQGSSDQPVEHHQRVVDSVESCTANALAYYYALLDEGVAPEQARMVLPQNTMTEWIWTGNVMSFARVCKQRLDPHAQKETRDVAVQLQDILLEHFPVSFKALMEN